MADNRNERWAKNIVTQEELRLQEDSHRKANWKR
jgi:hypothetical protein